MTRARTLNQKAMSLLSLLLIRNAFSIEGTLGEKESEGLQVLKQAKAVTSGTLSSQYAMCAFCGMHSGRIFRQDVALMVQCPDCGPFDLDPAYLRTCQLDEDWLIRKLRGALNIDAHAQVVALADGVWDIGRHKKRAVVLAKSIDLVMRHGLKIFHGAVPRPQSWVITPKPLGKPEPDPLAGIATWWHLEDRFALHGMALRLVDEAVQEGDTFERTDGVQQAVNGPFSENFEWVHLDSWPHGPIQLSQAQAAIFRELFKAGSTPQPADVIMVKAGLISEKLIDVFKIKAANRGDPRYEGPLAVYQNLVEINRRVGLYSLRRW